MPSKPNDQHALTPVRLTTLPRITQISCGRQHAIALDDEGYAYAWGNGTSGRLGNGSQRDRHAPVRVAQFAKCASRASCMLIGRKGKLDRVQRVFAGESCSVIVDHRARFWVAGCWRTSGEGGPAQGFFIFKPLPPLYDMDVRRIALGCDALYCIATEHGKAESKASDNPDNVADRQHAFAWGEGATHSELGMRGKVSADPVVCDALEGIDVLDVAGGLHTAFWLVRNVGATYADLPRYPVSIESPDLCLRCGERRDDDDTTLLACD